MTPTNQFLLALFFNFVKVYHNFIHYAQFKWIQCLLLVLMALFIFEFFILIHLLVGDNSPLSDLQPLLPISKLCLSCALLTSLLENCLLPLYLNNNLADDTSIFRSHVISLSTL